MNILKCKLSSSARSFRTKPEKETKMFEKNTLKVQWLSKNIENAHSKLRQQTSTLGAPSTPFISQGCLRLPIPGQLQIYPLLSTSIDRAPGTTEPQAVLLLLLFNVKQLQSEQCDTTFFFDFNVFSHFSTVVFFYLGKLLDTLSFFLFKGANSFKLVLTHPLRVSNITIPLSQD